MRGDTLLTVKVIRIADDSDAVVIDVTPEYSEYVCRRSVMLAARALIEKYGSRVYGINESYEED